MNAIPDDAIILCHSCCRSVASGSEIYTEDPQLLNRLRANEQFLTSEIPVILHEMDSAISVLQELDREIDLVDATKFALLRRRQSIAMFVSRKRSLFAPIRRLPREILLKIFAMACVEVDPVRSGSTPSLQRATAMEISQTGHLWRELMLSSPELWATIPGLSMYFPGRIRRDPDLWHRRGPMVLHEVDRQLLKLYLERSGGRQLDVNLEGANTAVKEDLSPIFHHRVERRIRSLVFNPNLLSRIRTFVFAGFCPGLKRLTFVTDNGYLEGTDPVYDFGLTFSLAEVNFRNVCPRRFKLPWQSLSTVSIWHCALDSIEYLEEVASQITCLELGNLHSTPCRKTRFPKVRNLVVVSESGHRAPLDVLCCPDVQEVDLVLEPWQSFRYLQESLEPRAGQGSVPQLHRLHLDVSEVELTELHSELRVFRNIRTLSLNFTWSPSPSLGNMRCKYNTTPEEISFFLASFARQSRSVDSDRNFAFLPQLEEICVTAHRVVVDSGILEFLASRRPIAKGEEPPEDDWYLKRFKLFARPGNRRDLLVDAGRAKEDVPPSEVVCADGVALESLRKLRGEGLHICINSDWSPLGDLKCLE